MPTLREDDWSKANVAATDLFNSVKGQDFPDALARAKRLVAFLEFSKIEQPAPDRSED